MQFKKLANLIIEAKGEKPGQRYHGAKQAAGPAGMSSTPIGRRDYNPTLAEPAKGKGMVDHKAAAVRKTEKILRHSFRVIKASPEFRRKLNDVLTRFDKKRKQIRNDQEKVLSYNPTKIDNLWGQKNRLDQVIAALDGDSRQKDYIKELEGVEDKILEYQGDLDDVVEQCVDIINTNELASKVGEGETIVAVQKAAQKEFDDTLTKMTDQEKAQTVLKSLDQIDPDMFDEETLNQDEYRLELLNVLMSGDPDENPIAQFFYLTGQQYEEAKNTEKHFAGAGRNTQNVSVEMLFNRLPMSAFSFFYNATHDDLPLSRISTKKRKQVRVYSPVKKILDKITTEEEWEAKKSEVKDMIDELDVDVGRMRALQDILTGPYKRRGATVVQRLLGMLKGVIQESHLPDTESDLVLLEILSKYSAD